LMRASKKYLLTFFLATALSAAAAASLCLFIFSEDNPLLASFPFFFVAPSNFLFLFLWAWAAILSAVVLALLPALAMGIFISSFAPPSKAHTLRALLFLFAAVPSVVYGAVTLAHLPSRLGNNILAVPFILASMIFPTIAKHTTSSLEAVPKSYREASESLGADLWKTTKLVVLPQARWSVLCGVIAGLGRALGETVVLLLLASKMGELKRITPLSSMKHSLLCYSVLFLAAALLGFLLQARLRRQV
jgi:phosphate transport system permease protein